MKTSQILKWVTAQRKEGKTTEQIEKQFEKLIKKMGIKDMKFKDLINLAIKWGKDNVSEFEENELSDGWHTFNDLYEFRKLYNAALFNEWGRFAIPVYDVHKSIRHYDGELCFGGGWFIVVAILPDGQISNHYKMDDWDLFKIPEVEKAKYPFDGHNEKDVMNRLRLALKNY